MSPFDEAVVKIASRQASEIRRHEALAQREHQMSDIMRILARGECLPQRKTDSKTIKDANLHIKWTPILQHPLPISYELFENEKELRRLAVLPPEDRILAAVAGGNAWCVEELFAQGCPADVKHGLGYTALHVAASRDDALVVKVLLNMKLDVNDTNLSGSTALACAIGGKGGEHGESARLLRAAGGVDSLGTVMDSPRCMLDVPLRQPRRAIDDIAEDLGRMTFTGQF